MKETRYGVVVVVGVVAVHPSTSRSEEDGMLLAPKASASVSVVVLLDRPGVLASSVGLNCWHVSISSD